jgi:hypothetical protein
MNRDTLFVRTLDDLAERTRPSADEYDVLLSAGLIRKLILDESPLVDQVNRDRRVRIRYRISQPGPYEQMIVAEGPLYWSIQDGLDPETNLTASPVEEVTRDAFLARVVMYVGGKDITVRDTILHTANVVGAVHAGKPHPSREETGRLLENMAAQLQIGGCRPDVRSLQAIGRVVVRALAPLRERIQQESASR